MPSMDLLDSSLDGVETSICNRSRENGLYIMGLVGIEGYCKWYWGGFVMIHDLKMYISVYQQHI